jgi:predicted nucleic acid-binding protein
LLVLDTSVAVYASQARDGFALLRDDDLHAPALLWSEARSAIRESLWRGGIDRERADRARQAIEECPVKLHTGTELGEQAWQLAVELGLARTYDAARG